MSDKKPDVFGPYRFQMRVLHLPLLAYVVQKLATEPKEIGLSFNQLSIFEYIDEHDENYTYHTYSMNFPGLQKDNSPDTPQPIMILAENNDCSRLMFGERRDYDLVIKVLEGNWSAISFLDFPA